MRRSPPRFFERSVLVAANLVRAVVVLITVLVAWFWLSRSRRPRCTRP